MLQCPRGNVTKLLNLHVGGVRKILLRQAPPGPESMGENHPPQILLLRHFISLKAPQFVLETVYLKDLLAL